MARRKITQPASLEDLNAADDLPDLTAQQMRFVHCILQGMTASDAYRDAYDAQQTSDANIWALASRTRSNVNVTSWLSAARKACLGTAVLTKDGHLQQLERLREIALDTGNVGAAVQAEQIRGKVAGHQIERYEDVTPIDPRVTLEELARISPQAAQALAAANGIVLIEHRADEVMNVGASE